MAAMSKNSIQSDVMSRGEKGGTETKRLDRFKIYKNGSTHTFVSLSISTPSSSSASSWLNNSMAVSAAEYPLLPWI
eukprot:SAG22_NODE_155_length_17123_cov_37.528489_21_plen_76_part_00